MNSPNRLSLLAVFAHPDDESWGAGGTLAHRAGEGAEVTLLCLTRGEFGGAPGPDKKPDPLLGQLRSGELRAACRELGVSRCLILDYPDGRLWGCDHYALERDIVRAIREARPQIIITSYPGGAEGEDHALAGAVTTLAWMGAGAPFEFLEHFTENLAPHSAQTLLYFYPGPLTEELLERFDVVRVDVSSYRERKAAALRCHVTQANCTAGALQDLQSQDQIYEQFVVGHSVLPIDDGPLSQLFVRKDESRCA